MRRRELRVDRPEFGGPALDCVCAFRWGPLGAFCGRPTGPRSNNGKLAAKNRAKTVRGGNVTRDPTQSCQRPDQQTVIGSDSKPISRNGESGFSSKFPPDASTNPGFTPIKLPLP